MSVLFRRALAILVAALLALPALAVPAFAHETKKAGNLVIGSFGLTGEPIVAGEQTEFEFSLSEAKSIDEGGKPVELTDAELKKLALHLFVGTPDKLDPTVQPDGKPMSLPIHATPWEGPGLYKSDPVIFASPGGHTAHLHSPLKGVAGATKTESIRGQVIDVQFPMSPKGGYGPVDDPSAIMFPAKVPTTAQLDQRIQRMEARNVALAAEATKAADDLNRLQNLTIILGTALAVVIVVGALAFLSSRSRRGRVGDKDPSDQPMRV